MSWTYEDQKEHANRRSRTGADSIREIGPLPAIIDPERRESCRLDLRRFCEVYFPAAFDRGWSNDHLRVIGIIQTAVLHGGLSAVAMPRGNGKTTMCTVAAIWSLVYGHRSWVVVLGATQPAARTILKNIITHCESNPDLLADFPAAVYPIRRLERIPQRAGGQMLGGEPTRIGWTAEGLVLPTVAGACSSGARVSVSGITGGFRGMNATLADGSIIRPDFCLIDDPQTKESARSHQQTEERLSIIRGDVLGLAGTGTKISAVAPVTVIAKGDLADQLLDRKRNPEWQGVKTKLLNKEPTNAKLWEQYAEVWADGHRQELGLAPATEFYREHRADMDAGAEAAWSERHNEDEISAVQNAMNLKLRDEAAFFAEYQNDPVSLDAEAVVGLKPDEITVKTIALKQGTVPDYATKLTAFVDVQKSVLFYVVIAFSDKFSGHIVDYGTFPKQAKNYFFLREVSPSLQDVYPQMPLEGQVRAGLDSLADSLLDRQWERQDGTTQKIDLMAVDSGNWTTVIKQMVAESRHKQRLIATKGYGVKAENNPLDTWRIEEKNGDRRGWSWIWNRTEGHVLFDTNTWKTFATERLKTAKGADGAWTLFDGTPTQHKLFAEQVTAEWSVPVEGRGRIVNVWKPYPNRDNHWGDCLVGAAVAASERGVRFVGHQEATGTVAVARRRKVSIAV